MLIRRSIIEPVLRIVLNTLTAVLLLLSLTATGLWLRSHVVGDTLRCEERRRYVETKFAFVSEAGEMMVVRHWYHWEHLSDNAPIKREPDYKRFDWERNEHPRRWADGMNQSTFWDRVGFDVLISRRPTYTFHRLGAPYWFVVVVLALVPGWRLACWWRRRRRRRLGHCFVCGYDMRATPDRCPECGQVPDAARERAG